MGVIADRINWRTRLVAAPSCPSYAANAPALRLTHEKTRPPQQKKQPPRARLSEIARRSDWGRTLFLVQHTHVEWREILPLPRTVNGSLRCKPGIGNFGFYLAIFGAGYIIFDIRRSQRVPGYLTRTGQGRATSRTTARCSCPPFSSLVCLRPVQTSSARVPICTWPGRSALAATAARGNFLAVISENFGAGNFC